MNFATAVIGPLMVPECKRSARRGWGLLVRAFAGVVMALPALVATWWWWMGQEMDSTYQPRFVIPVTLFILECLALGIVLILSPAILAGSLAGERERGSIGLLLSTSVNAREIVLGRMFGLLSLVAAMLMAGLPFLLMFASLGGLSIPATLCLVALPVAVGLGIGGISMAASAMARRGRVAMILIYVIEAVVLLVPSLAIALLPVNLRAGFVAFLAPVSPFLATFTLVMGAGLQTVLISISVWLAAGIVGVTLAALRLRSSYLALDGGNSLGMTRRHRVPAVDENRPMLWKELHIERIGALGWFGRVLGVLLMLYLVLGTIVMAGLTLWALHSRRDTALYDSYLNTMSALYEEPAFLVSVVIQLAVGLRAAVAISSEREQGTWDALLASPLSGREILWGKLWGSLYSLRFFLAAILFSWGVSTALGAMDWKSLLTYVGMTVVVSAFAAAVGVRASLSSETATRSMSITVGVWAGTGVALAVLGGLTILVVMLVCLLSWMLARPLGLVAMNSRPWIPTYLFDELWFGVIGISYVVLTGLVVMAARTRFDEIAGRLKGDGSDRPPAPRFLPDDGKCQVREESLVETVKKGSAAPSLHRGPASQRGFSSGDRQMGR